MQHVQRAVIALLVCSLLGCATMSEEECRGSDWYDVGLRDGREAKPFSRVTSYVDACAAFGVRPDTDAWEEGRAAGLAEFCQLPVAIERGLNRYSYDRVCGDPDFERLYLAAKALGDARHAIETNDAEIARKEEKLIKDEDLTDEKRREIELEIRNLERSRDRLRDDRSDAERRLERLRAELGV